ncbi:helical backbone metal receptor [Nocardioides alcanivorans]|uniref:helical backbone metal receptor n=1 Tax=Nocardioides alcanivorans TaxID=2897352 RepID=UPI001F1E6301|nr:helical backbone metal receptor [Nocardioides alcanivorans]
MALDDLGHDVQLRAAPRRVVSLVPSLTEAIAATAPEMLVGATDWCTHPAGLDVARVRGTKNPDLPAIRALAPDLVVANQEENRELDVRRLRESGVPVWVTRTESVAEALDAMERLFIAALRVEVPGWLAQARVLWSTAAPEWGSVAVPIWRDPWMVVGRDTYTGDLLRLLGCRNVFADADGRYPHAEVAEIVAARPDLVLLPDEPYAFTADDGPEAFPGLETRLVSGRLLTWYGPALVEAHTDLARLLGRPTIY